MEEIVNSMEEIALNVEEKQNISDITTEEISDKPLHTEVNENVLSDNESVPSKENYSERGSPIEQIKESISESDHSCTDSESSVILEREEGDGQESIPPKKIDDDEDKKNPQYIPKRGTFYEHDDRTADDIENEEEQQQDKNEKEGKKKVWQDKKEKWSHDRFNDNEQAPKSRSELIAIYGYDIRNEDGPPRARRRRRYGRGPNKYTRNWEDEDAYSKPPLNSRRTPKKKNNRTNSDNLSEEDNVTNESDIFEDDSKEEKHVITVETSNEFNKNIDEDNTTSLNSSSHDSTNFKQGSTRVGSGRVSKPKRDTKNNEYRGFTKPRNFDMKKDQRVLPKQYKKEDYIHSQNFTNKIKPQTQDLERDMSKLSVNEGGYKNNKYNNQRQVSVPPRLQNEQKGSKRYSSMRQRSLPETTNPPFNQHSNFYPNEFNQQNQSNSTQQQSQPQQQQTQPGIIQHQNPQIHSNATQIPQIPPPPLAPLAQQVPVTSTPILQAPPQFAPSYPQPPPNFLQPGVAPPPFIPPQTPQIINYVQGQPQFPSTPFQGYQQQFNTVTQPAELYQPQGGITYYSPQDQQQTQRAAPPKRPKAAIPIVPPPPHEPRGRGRSNLIDNSNTMDGTTNNNQDSSLTFEDASSAVTVEQ